MKSKKVNKLFNIIIFILVVSIGLIYGKQEIFKNSYSYKDDNKSSVSNNIDSNLEIYFFDVGQADSILIKNNDDTVLIDAGNRNDGENLANYIKNDLKINDIDIVIGTHPHEDHIGGMSYIIDSFDIGKIYLPDVTSNAKFFEKLLDSIESKDYKISVPKVGEEIKLNNLVFNVLSVDDNDKNINDCSIVLKLNYLDTKYLFMGDASKSVEKKLLDKDIKADVIKIGHHGSSYSSSNKFLESVNPNIAIISVGKDNKYKHPTNNVLNTLNNLNIKYYRTDIDGTIKLVSDGKNIEINKIKTNIDG